MIKKFVERFKDREMEIKARFSENHPGNYMEVVKIVIETLSRGETHKWPDPERIHEIDDGDYQGTLVYVIANLGYQPAMYWYVKVGYGSCSGCDELESIREGGYNKPTDEQVHDYMTLVLHIVQGLRPMD